MRLLFWLSELKRKSRFLLAQKLFLSVFVIERKRFYPEESVVKNLCHRRSVNCKLMCHSDHFSKSIIKGISDFIVLNQPY